MTARQHALPTARRTSTTLRYAALPLVLSALLMSGCSSNGGGASSSPAQDSAARSEAGGNGSSAADSSGGTGFADQSQSAGGDPAKAAAVPALLADRRLIQTASLEVTVASSAQSAARVRSLVAAAGGYIASEQTSSTPRVDVPVPEQQSQSLEDTTGGQATPGSSQARDPYVTSMLTVRVPSAQLGTLTDQVAALGTVTQRSQDSKDVTQQSVDVASRLATQKASIARIRVLLAKANRIGDIVNIESELSRREADLESMQAQLKSLNDSVELSTLTVSLVPQGAKAKASDDDNGFVAGLQDGWDAFTGALVVGLTVIGALLPFAITLALLAVPALLVWRRRRAARPADPTHVPAVLSEG